MANIRRVGTIHWRTSPAVGGGTTTAAGVRPATGATRIAMTTMQTIDVDGTIITMMIHDRDEEMMGTTRTTENCTGKFNDCLLGNFLPIGGLMK